MAHLDMSSIIPKHKLLSSQFSEDECDRISKTLEETDEWKIATVTTNGRGYMVFPKVRRQKIIDYKDVESDSIKHIMNKVISESYRLYPEFDPNGYDNPQEDLILDTCQLIRSDMSDFFAWHADTTPEMGRHISLIISFNDEQIGGEVEVLDSPKKGPQIHHLNKGQALMYCSLAHSRYHKILRGSHFYALCILKRSEDRQAEFLEKLSPYLNDA